MGPPNPGAEDQLRQRTFFGPEEGGERLFCRGLLRLPRPVQLLLQSALALLPASPHLLDQLPPLLLHLRTEPRLLSEPRKSMLDKSMLAF